MKRKPVLVVSLGLLLVLSYLLLIRSDSNPMTPPMALALVPEYPSTVPLIDLTNSGFTPANSAITAGQSVIFRNSTTTSHMLMGDGFLRETSILFLPFIAKNGASFAQADSRTRGQEAVAGTGTNNQPLVNTCQFQVPLPPGAEYTHEYSNAGECHVYLTTAVHTANIAVNSAFGPATLSGRVLDTSNAVQGNERPVVSAVISLLGTGITAVTDNQGYLFLSIERGSSAFSVKTAVSRQ